MKASDIMQVKLFVQKHFEFYIFKKAVELLGNKVLKNTLVYET